MIALDTNVIVRVLVRDEEQQALQAAALIRDNDVLITSSVLLEIEWVLRLRYRQPRDIILTALRALIGLPTVVLQDQDATMRAIDWFAAGLDFADALHLASSAAASKFATFNLSWRPARPRFRRSPWCAVFRC